MKLPHGEIMQQEPGACLQPTVREELISTVTGNWALQRILPLVNPARTLVPPDPVCSHKPEDPAKPRLGSRFTETMSSHMGVFLCCLDWGWFVTFSKWLSGEEPTCQCRKHRFDPWVGKIPWRRKWQPIPILLPGESYGQRSLAD